MVGEFLSAFAKLRRATIGFFMSVRLSVHPHGITRLPLDGFSWNFVFEYFFFLKSVEKIQITWKSNNSDGYFTWGPICVSDHIPVNSSWNKKCFIHKICGDNQNKHFIFNNGVFFFNFKRAICEIMWKFIVEPDRLQMKIWHTRIACWITLIKSVNVHSEYVILIAFPLQQHFLESTSILRYTYISCLFYFMSLSVRGGTAVAHWLRCCATNRKVAGLIPASIIVFFFDIKSFRSH